MTLYYVTYECFVVVFFCVVSYYLELTFSLEDLILFVLFLLTFISKYCARRFSKTIRPISTFFFTDDCTSCHLICKFVFFSVVTSGPELRPIL